MNWRDEQKQQEEKRQKAREYRSRVSYRVYSGGGDADRIDYERVGDCLRSGDSSDQAAAQELRLQREARARREQKEDDKSRCAEQEEHERNERNERWEKEQNAQEETE